MWWKTGDTLEARGNILLSFTQFWWKHPCIIGKATCLLSVEQFSSPLSVSLSRLILVNWSFRWWKEPWKGSICSKLEAERWLLAEWEVVAFYCALMYTPSCSPHRGFPWQIISAYIATWSFICLCKVQMIFRSFQTTKLNGFYSKCYNTTNFNLASGHLIPLIQYIMHSFCGIFLNECCPALKSFPATVACWGLHGEDPVLEASKSKKGTLWSLVVRPTYEPSSASSWTSSVLSPRQTVVLGTHSIQCWWDKRCVSTRTRKTPSR